MDELDEEELALGYIKSPHDLRDYNYSMLVCNKSKKEKPIEKILDYQYPILDQGNVGSCLAHALSRMKSYIFGCPIYDTFSIGFIYAYREESDNQTSGLVPRQALKNICKYGDCKQKTFPINEEYPGIVQTMKTKYNLDSLLKEASQYKSLAYVRLQPEEYKDYIVEFEKPILVCVSVYKNFSEANTNGGIIPPEGKGYYRGGHAMLGIGYDKNNRMVLVNSYGPNKGNRGLYYLDIDADIIDELWVLEDKKNVNPPIKKEYTIGWNQYPGGWFYSEDGYTKVCNDWKKINGIWYFFEEDGHTAEGKWVKWKNQWYYLDKGSCAMHIGWLKDGDKWYYLDKKTGAMVTGWFQDTDGKWYYLDIDKGWMYSDTTILIEGKYYSFDKSGAMK